MKRTVTVLLALLLALSLCGCSGKVSLPGTSWKVKEVKESQEMSDALKRLYPQIVFTDGENGYFGEDTPLFNFTYTQKDNELSITVAGASDTITGKISGDTIELEITKVTFIFTKK